ncbi:MAG: carboxymuconolactone decarboxylase family protein [Alphaproteobacteria bacterium]
MPNIHIPDHAMTDPLGYALTRHSPVIGRAAGEFVKSVYQSVRLPLRLAEAARYRIAQINGCLVCKGFRAADHLDGYLDAVGGDRTTSLVARGGERPDEDFYAAIDEWQTSPLLNDRERLAVDLAERMAFSPNELGYDEEFWAKMRAAFDDAEIADLTLAIGMWMAMGRFTHALGLDTVCLPTSAAA